MTDSSIQQVSPNTQALNAEHYQSFEVAKANDDVLASDNIAQIRSYAAYARAQAQAIHKTIAATNGIEDVASIKAEATETAQTFAKVGIYADQRIGEILRELPTKQGARNDITSVGTPTKVEAEKQAGIGHATAIDLQKMAANPEVVQAVIDKATADGKVVSRNQVIRAIKERDEARKEASMAEWDAAELRRKMSEMEEQADKAFEEGFKAAEEQQRYESEHAKEVVREVVPEDVQRRINELERLNNLYLSDYQKLRRRNEDMRKELDRARDILNLDETTRDVQRDVQYLVTSTNQYVRHYGGLTWTVQSLSDVDEQTIKELHKAVRNLATFANTLMNCLEEING